MLAAYRVYAKNEALPQVAAEAKLEEPQLARWVEYLKDRSRPELAHWRAATDANRKNTAAEYQEEFRRSAYQYDQDLSWWKQAQSNYPQCGKDRRTASAHDGGEGPVLLRGMAATAGRFTVRSEEQFASLTPEKAAQARDLLAQAAAMEKTLPTKEVPMACAVKEGDTMDQKVFLRGDYHNLGDPVRAHGPRDSSPAARPRPTVKTNSGRLELADWIVDPRNPLPARVMANRIWQGHFGDGIVRTPDNFGKLGDRPSNPGTARLSGDARSSRAAGRSRKCTG